MNYELDLFSRFEWRPLYWNTGGGLVCNMRLIDIEQNVIVDQYSWYLKSEQEPSKQHLMEAV